MWKLLILICFLLFVTGFIYMQSDSEKETEIEEEGKLYPVPEGYDLEYFRKSVLTRGVGE